jgi:hypothetical protein
MKNEEQQWEFLMLVKDSTHILKTFVQKHLIRQLDEYMIAQYEKLEIVPMIFLILLS